MKTGPENVTDNGSQYGRQWASDRVPAYGGVSERSRQLMPAPAGSLLHLLDTSAPSAVKHTDIDDLLRILAVLNADRAADMGGIAERLIALIQTKRTPSHVWYVSL